MSYDFTRIGFFSFRPVFAHSLGDRRQCIRHDGVGRVFEAIALNFAFSTCTGA